MMLDFIHGTLEKVHNGRVYFRSGERGYRLHFQDMARREQLVVGNSYKFFVCEVNTEFENFSCAFLDEHRRDMFAELVKLKTVGTKTATMLVNSFEYDAFVELVRHGDVDRLLELKGIGSFTARLVVSEMQKVLFNYRLTAKQEKVLVSLEKLGYKTRDIYTALLAVKSSLKLEEMTRRTLERIGEANGNDDADTAL